VLPFEAQARLLLVLHAVLGAATVAVSTHLVVWMRGYLRGKPQRKRAVRRFAWMSLALFGLTFVVGTLGYPVYKVRVRSGYLDNPAAIEAALGGDDRSAAQAVHERTTRMGRWFDVKEHWAALGLMLTVALVLILRTWEPTGEAAVIAPLVVGMAAAAAATAWMAAIIGLLTSSFRAIGT
jgi:hypothetical protein